ncbi:MAG: hypothetical protein ACR2LX_08890 [Jatrophihabitans sp.]
MNVRRAIKVGAVGLVTAFVLAGCHIVGGGTLPSASGSGKAQFSFDLSCKPGTTAAKGTLTYLDTPAGVRIRGTVTGIETPENAPCGPNSFIGDGDLTGTFTGTYTTLDRSGSGSFSLSVSPGNSVRSPGAANVSLHLTGGPYDGYSNSGDVIDGQIVPVGGPNA